MAGGSEFPASALFADQTTAWVPGVLRFVDVEELEARSVLDLGLSLGDDAEREAVEVEMEFVGGDTTFGGCGVGFNELRITLEPGEIGGIDPDATKGGLLEDECGQVKFVGIVELEEKDLERIDADEIASIPEVMVVALAGKGFLIPVLELVVDHEDDFEVEMGALFGDALASIGGSAHGGERLTGADGLSWLQILVETGEVRVKGVEFPALDVVLENGVDAIAGEGGIGVEIGDGAVGGGEDGIGRFAAVIELDGADVEAFVELPAFGPHTAEGATGPWASDGTDEVIFLGIGMEEGLVRGG
jgi:hypothetical protein